MTTARAHPNAFDVWFVNDVFPISMLEVITGQVERLPGDASTDVYQAVCTVGAFALGCAALERSYLDMPATGAADADDAGGADTPDRLVDTALAVCGSDCSHMFDVGLELIIRGCQPQRSAE